MLPRLAARFRDAHVEMRADTRSLGLLQNAKLANDDDWGREFLDLIQKPIGSSIDFKI